MHCCLYRCVPSQSTAKIKLELLPLTDGIITLDTLQIYVKETGNRYINKNKNEAISMIRSCLGAHCKFYNTYQIASCCYVVFPNFPSFYEPYIFGSFGFCLNMYFVLFLAA